MKRVTITFMDDTSETHGDVMDCYANGAVVLLTFHDRAETMYPAHRIKRVDSVRIPGAWDHMAALDAPVPAQPTAVPMGTQAWPAQTTGMAGVAAQAALGEQG